MHPTNPISPKRIKNATKRAKSAMASERAKPKMAYPKSCFESDGLHPIPLEAHQKDADDTEASHEAITEFARWYR